jgi:hypothetical protein
MLPFFWFARQEPVREQAGLRHALVQLPITAVLYSERVVHTAYVPEGLLLGTAPWNPSSEQRHTTLCWNQLFLESRKRAEKTDLRSPSCMSSTTQSTQPE